MWPGHEATMFIDDIMLPCQLNARLDRDPQRQLLVAVFIDALSCVVDLRTNSKHRLAALDWFDDDTPHDDYSLTFLYICEVLGYNPAQWRHFVHQPPIAGRQFRRASVSRIKRERTRNHSLNLKQLG